MHPFVHLSVRPGFKVSLNRRRITREFKCNKESSKLELSRGNLEHFVKSQNLLKFSIATGLALNKLFGRKYKYPTVQSILRSGSNFGGMLGEKFQQKIQHGTWYDNWHETGALFALESVQTLVHELANKLVHKSFKLLIRKFVILEK